MEPITLTQEWDDFDRYSIYARSENIYFPVRKPIWEVNIDGETTEISEAAAKAISDYIRENKVWGADTEQFIRDIINPINNEPPKSGRAFITKKNIKSLAEANKVVEDSEEFENLDL